MEICKVAAVTLTHEQMIDLLRTSVTVKVVIIPPYDEGGPRRCVPVCMLCFFRERWWMCEHRMWVEPADNRILAGCSGRRTTVQHE